MYDNKGGCPLRGRIWKALIRLGVVDVQHYLDLVQSKLPSESIPDIVIDVGRTFGQAVCKKNHEIILYSNTRNV